MSDVIEMAREAWEKAGEGGVHPDWYADREKAFKEFPNGLAHRLTG